MRARWVAMLALAAGLGATAAGATELRLLSAGAVELGLMPALAVFQRESGHSVQIEFAAAPALAGRFATAPGFDLVIAPAAVLDTLARAGTVGSERVPVDKVGIGVAVRADAARAAAATALLRFLDSPPARRIFISVGIEATTP